VDREAVDYRDFVGRAEAVIRVDIRSQATGNLVKIYFRAGTVVHQGDLLFEIDSRLQQAAREKAAAECQLAHARIQRLAVELRRTMKLSASGDAANEDIDRTKAELEEAQKAAHVAEAGLKLAQLQLEFTRICAPISGKIGLSAVNVGNLVTADKTSLATIVSTDPVYISFEVDERTALQVYRKAQKGREKGEGKSGLPVSCALADETGCPRQGVVDAVNSHVDPATGTMRMRALLQNPDGLIVPGMSVRVRLALSKH